MITLSGGFKPYIWRTPKEEYHPSLVMPHFGRERGGIMVWAAICHGGKSRLVRFDTQNSHSRRQGITTSIYCNQITNGALREFMTAMEMVTSDSQVLEDNAPVHTASISRSQGLNNGFSFINHPATSPDLNPIENCWHWLKQAIRRLPRRPTSLRELWQVASEL